MKNLEQSESRRPVLVRSAESAVGERPKSVVSRAVDIASREIEEVEAHKRDVPRGDRKRTIAG